MKALAGGAVLVAVAAVLVSTGPAEGKAEPECAAGGIKVSSTASPATIRVNDTRTNTTVQAVVTITGTRFTIASADTSLSFANASWCLKSSTQTQTGAGITGGSNIRNKKGVAQAIGYLVVYGVTSVQPAAWTLTKSADPSSGSTVNPGDTITYTLTVTDVSSDQVTGAVVTDDLSQVLPYATLGTVGAGATVTGTTLTWTVPNLQVGSAATVSFTVTVDEDVVGVDLHNVASPSTAGGACPSTADCTTDHTTP